MLHSADRMPGLALPCTEAPLPAPVRPVVVEQLPREPFVQTKIGSRIPRRDVGFTAAILLSGILLGALVVSISAKPASPDYHANGNEGLRQKVQTPSGKLARPPDNQIIIGGAWILPS
jgi:hypothetical protein